MPTIAVVAPGAMGSALAVRLKENGARVLTSLAGRSEKTAARALASGMEHAEDAELARADLLLSIVPPAEAVALAVRLVPHLSAAADKAIYVDLNAVNVETVRAVAALIEPTGARFVDGAIIGLPPKPGTKGPRVHLSGPDLTGALTLRGLGLDARECAGGIGAASSLKMSYAGINKGLTALAALMILGAARNGAADALAAELAENEPELFARFQRGLPDMVPKAHRWVAEMREIAAFLGEDRAGSLVFEGAAQLYERLAVGGNEDATALIAFAENAAKRSQG